MSAFGHRLNGFLLMLLGAWGAAVPYFGPHIGLHMATSATFSAAHLELNLLPGLAVFLAGAALLLVSRAAAPGWLAVLGGAWFVVGPLFASLWLGARVAQTQVAPTTVHGTLGPLTYHYGLGVVIVAMAAWRIGRAALGGAVANYPGAPVGSGRHAVTTETAPVDVA